MEEDWCCAFSLRLLQLLQPGWEGSSLTTPEINFDYFNYYDDYFDDHNYNDDHSSQGGRVIV